MRTFEEIGIQIPEVLLPKAGSDLKRWAVIACDQYTSQPEYWQKVADYVGTTASTLHLILPEVYLESEDSGKRVEAIQKMMLEYQHQGIFTPCNDLIYVERRRGNLTRKGILLALDLERYDYKKGSQSLIRATEATIQERIPPRLKIRDGAPLELPHIMILINDAKKTVIEPLTKSKAQFPVLYDFDLMMESGHLQGFAVNSPEIIAGVADALRKLAGLDQSFQKEGLGNTTPPLLFAVGDGNHSMATAKAYWEKIKPNVAPNHPARYALVEVVNLFDDGLIFEPIHRLLFGLHGDIKSALEKAFPGKVHYSRVGSHSEMIARVRSLQADTDKHVVGFVAAGEISIVEIRDPSANLPVMTIQGFVENILKDGLVEKADYIHDDDALFDLGQEPGNAGFFMPAIDKTQLFPTVIKDGNLPRKAFSMGQALDKRFYMECKKIEA